MSSAAAILAVFQTRKTALTEIYFAEMVQAYSDYLRCVSEFALRRGAPERDALVAALYRLGLFAPQEIFDDAQDLYALLLERAASNTGGPLGVDGQVHDLREALYAHLDQARKHGRF